MSKNRTKGKGNYLFSAFTTKESNMVELTALSGNLVHFYFHPGVFGPSWTQKLPKS